MILNNEKYDLKISAFVLQCLENKRKAWTLEEKVFLETFLNQAGGIHNKGSNLFWKKYAVMLNKHYGTNKTGKIRYLKCRLSFDFFAIY